MSKALPKIAHDVLRYIHEHPEAADTPEGVAKWWLRDRYPLTRVREVLAKLVAEGLLVEREGRNHEVIYRQKKIT
jgi:hypothetical protein